jgi:hypothetical protein
MANIDKQLEEAELQYQSEVKALEEKHKQKTKDLLAKAKASLKEHIEAIPERFRREIFEDSDISKLLNVQTPAKKIRLKMETVKTRHKVKDDEILSFLKSEQPTSEIIKNFGFSSAATASTRLNNLEKQSLVKWRKDKTTKFWVKV